LRSLDRAARIGGAACGHPEVTISNSKHGGPEELCGRSSQVLHTSSETTMLIQMTSVLVEETPVDVNFDTKSSSQPKKSPGLSEREELSQAPIAGESTKASPGRRASWL
jgi:hypothetical protein